MLKSVLTKTLFEKRWMMLLWSIGVIVMSMVMMAFYHSFSGGEFTEALKALPKQFQGLIGDIDSLKTVGGYVGQEIFSLRIPLLTLIMGIVLFTSLLAGDERDGTLQTLLAQPISRFRVFIQKYMAGLIISGVICASAIIGIRLSLVLIHESMSMLRLVQAVLGVYLLTVMFGTLGFALGAITSKKGLAGSLTGMFAFVSYMITSFAPSVSWLKNIDTFSPFHYYNNPNISIVGIKGSNVTVMLSIIAISLIVSAFIFHKRDIYQR